MIGGGIEFSFLSGILSSHLSSVLGISSSLSFFLGSSSGSFSSGLGSILPSLSISSSSLSGGLSISSNPNSILFSGLLGSFSESLSLKGILLILFSREFSNIDLDLLVWILVITIAVALLGDSWKWILSEEMVLAWSHSVVLGTLHSVWGVCEFLESGLWISGGRGGTVENLTIGWASTVLTLSTARLWLSWDWGLAPALLCSAWGDVSESLVSAMNLIVSWVLLSEAPLERLSEIH